MGATCKARAIPDESAASGTVVQGEFGAGVQNNKSPVNFSGIVPVLVLFIGPGELYCTRLYLYFSI